LDHIITLGRRHPRRVLEEFSLRHFNTGRPHPGIAQRVPIPSSSQIYRKGAKIDSVPYFGDSITIVKWPHDDVDRQRSQQSTWL
jgi:hypothetical protein